MKLKALCYYRCIAKEKKMNRIENVKSFEQAEKLAAKIGGTLIMLSGTTAIIAGGDLSKLEAK